MVKKRKSYLAKKKSPKLAQRLPQYETSRKTKVQIPHPVDNYDLPVHYGTTCLTLMVKDPFWIYAYWEISPDDIQNLARKLPSQNFLEAKLILRLYDVTCIDFNGANAHSSFDIEIGPDCNNWYINLWQDNISYIGEIGFRTKSGDFYALGRSNWVHTPRLNYSQRTEQIWMKVEEGGVDSAYVIAKPKSFTLKASQDSASRKPYRGKTIYVSEEDIRCYYSKLNPLLRDVLALRLGRIYGRRIKDVILEGESEFDKQRLFNFLPGTYFIKEIRSGASESLVFLGASENLVCKK